MKIVLHIFDICIRYFKNKHHCIFIKIVPDTLKYFTINADCLKIKFFCVLFLYCFCYPKLLTYLKVSILHRTLALVIKSNINGILIPCMSRFSEKEMLPNCWCHIVGKMIFIQNKIWYSLYILHKLFPQAFLQTFCKMGRIDVTRVAHDIVHLLFGFET